MSIYVTALLTDSDLCELTGVVQPSAQRKWLEEQGIGFALRRDGKPRTTWGAVDSKFVSQRSTPAEPKFERLR